MQTSDYLSIFAIVVSLIVGIISALPALRRAAAEASKSQSESDKIDTETITLLKQQVNELVKSDAETRKKMEELDKELIKFTKAYYKLLKFTRTHLTTVEIPDFLKDTDPKIV